MESLLPILIQLVSGAAGGNIAGALFKNLSLGTLWNSVAGVAGGGLGGLVLNSVLHTGPAATGALDLPSILTSVAASGVGGGGLMAIISLVRGMMAK